MVFAPRQNCLEFLTQTVRFFLHAPKPTSPSASNDKDAGSGIGEVTDPEATSIPVGSWPSGKLNANFEGKALPDASVNLMEFPFMLSSVISVSVERAFVHLLDTKSPREFTIVVVGVAGLPDSWQGRIPNTFPGYRSHALQGGKGEREQVTCLQIQLIQRQCVHRKRVCNALIVDLIGREILQEVVVKGLRSG